jgi:hypothetical protein
MFTVPRVVADLSAVLDLIAPPDLNQARVNKCLIALVNRKVVQKDNSSVSFPLQPAYRMSFSI